MADVRIKDATAVILVGALDFGRCEIGSRLHRPLWPLFDRPILEYQLKLLARQGVRQAVVCINDRPGVLEKWINPYAFGSMDVDFVADVMPRGAAGSVRDAVAGRAKGPVIVIKGGMAWVGDAPQLVEAHLREGAALTVFTSGAFRKDASNARPAGIYVCDPSTLDVVSPTGYQDIKEQLIPALLRGGRPVKAVPLPGEMIGGLGHESYLAIVERALESPDEFGIDLKRFTRFEGNVLVEQGARIAPSARIFGPAAVLDGAAVEDNAVIAGPAAIGRGGRVGRGALIDSSVLWQGARVGSGAVVADAVIGDGAHVPAGRRIVGSTVAGPRTGRASVGKLGKSMGRLGKALGSFGLGTAKPEERPSAVSWRPGGGRGERREPNSVVQSALPWGVAAVVLVASFVWSYSSVLADLWRVWMGNDNYSSGVLVPLLAVYVAAAWRKDLAKAAIEPFYGGLVLVIAGFALRVAGTVLMFASVERFSTVVVIWGIVLTLFGTAVTRRLVWVLLFLLLMLPWPNRVYSPVSLALQNWATGSTVFLLETIGRIVMREGNVIVVDGTPVAVAEACSGLRMLTAFMVVSGLVALACNRSRWEKALVFVSSVPIAVACNTLRLTATALAFAAGYGPKVNELFHGVGGYAMMPLALAIMAGELWVTKRLFVPAGPAQGGREGKRSEADVPAGK